MSSLFARILAWFLATAVISVIGSVVIVRLTAPEFRRDPDRGGRALTLHATEAQHQYENGGQQGLRGFMDRLQTVYRGDSYFTDENGRDLLNGADRSAILRAARTRPNAPIRLGPQSYLVASADQERYWLFVAAPEGPLGLPPIWGPLWQIPFIVLLCYALAKRLTAPVRDLEEAVQRFGSGNLSARVDSLRRDELGALSRAFDQMASRIQTLVSGQRRLLLDISHELRSPLTRLSLAVELARSQQNNEGALDRIHKEADRLNALIGEIVSITRFETDPALVRKSRVAVDELLARIIDDCSLEAIAKSCRIELTIAGRWEIEGDEELLRRAFENVIRNAIWYTTDTIDIRVSGDGSSIAIVIRDYGPGVPEESIPFLFDPFYRVDADRSRSSGGVGLGLAIARRSVDLHEGTIQATNANPGLLVTICLPHVANSPAHPPEPAPKKHA